MNAHYQVKEKLLPLTLAVSAMIVSLVVPEGFNYAEGLVTSSSGFNRTLWLLLLGFGLYALGRHLKECKKVFLGNRYLVALTALALLSYFWSTEPSVTIRRIMRILAVFSVCISFAAAMKTTRSFQSSIRPVLTLLLGGSIIFALTAPQFGVEQLPMAELVGAWKGLTTQKNALGALATLGTLFWLHAWISKQSRQPWPMIGTIISLICLIKSRSSTSIMATLFSSVLMLMLMRSPGSLKRYMPYLVGIFVTVILIYSLAVLKVIPGSDVLLSPIAAITGKDLTFSGRTAIWDIVSAHSRLHPFLGTGYGGYWVGPDPASASFETLVKLEFYPSEAHNGYLDIMNDLGWIGELFLLGYVITYLRQALKLYRLDRGQGAIYLVILFHQMIGNLSESMWFNVLVVEFVIVTLASFCLTRALQLHEEQARRTVHQPATATPAPASPQHRHTAAPPRSVWDKLRR